ncbi:MAG: glutamyl-tRNA reductase [Flavobacteriia bacterium]|nr:glutamyl-tRNA reductase [Flavobacteriia bacterium]
MERSATYLDHLHIFGVSYKTAGVHDRQAFSLNETEQHVLLASLRDQTDFKGFIVSTCNRTEIIGTSEQPEAVLALFLDVANTDHNNFDDLGYHISGHKALVHLFRMGVGMESQIPGDFEIIMQVRKGFRKALKAGTINGYLEKIINQVIHASKRVKTETAYSTGATSVSYAAAKYIKDSNDHLENAKITLYGLGKFGRITLDHLLGLTDPSNITLVNRSDEKSEQYARETGAVFCPHTELTSAIESADILIVATGADRPILQVEDLNKPALHTVIDMAVPSNVNPEVGSLPQLKLLNVDELSQMTKEALQQRHNQAPQVEQILSQEIQELLDWHVMRTQSPKIKASIESLLETKYSSLPELVSRAYEQPMNDESEEEYLRHKMQRYFCHHIRRGKTVDMIQTELSSRVSVTHS